MKKIGSLICAAVIGISLQQAVAASSDTVATLSVKGGCAMCHTAAKKLIGPSYHDIAARYKGRADAVDLLTHSVRSGSKGVWGPVAMPPTLPAKLGDGDLRKLLAGILS